MADLPAHLAILAKLAGDRLPPHLNNRHLQIIALLCAEPDPDRRSPTAIGRALAIPPNSMSRASRRLRQLGLIARHSHPDNLRFAVLSPTRSGRALDLRIRTAFDTDDNRGHTHALTR